MTSLEFVFILGVLAVFVFVHKTIEKRKEERELMEDDDE